jgi:diacylglycerol kinase family enzyme
VLYRGKWQRAGDAVIANLVSAGLSGQVAAVVPHQLKRVAGRAAYPLTALAALPRHRPPMLGM